MRIFRNGDGTPQLVRPNQTGQEHPFDRKNPQPPCIILEEGEATIFADESHTAHNSFVEEVRRTAFDLLREHPHADSVTVNNLRAEKLHRYKQTDRLNEEEPGISLAAGNHTYVSQDYFKEDEVLWVFAHHATVREASDIVDTYNGLVNRQERWKLFDTTPFYAAQRTMRRIREQGDAPASPSFPEITRLPEAFEMRISTVSAITLLSPTSAILAEQLAEGMYVIVPPSFPTRCTLSVSPLLCWASYTDDEGLEHHFIARPATTAAAAWANYESLRTGTPRLPETLVSIEGKLVECRRTADRGDETAAYYLHHCEMCQFVGCLDASTHARVDFYFCTKRPVPEVAARYNHNRGSFYMAPYHEARGGKSFSDTRVSGLLELAAALARTKGLTALYDQHPGRVHNLVIEDAEGRKATEALTQELGRILGEDAKAQDTILVATAEHAVFIRRLLEQVVPNSGIVVIYKHQREGEDLRFSPESQYDRCKARLVGAVDESIICVFIEGLGFRAVPAEDTFGSTDMWDELSAFQSMSRLRRVAAPELLSDETRRANQLDEKISGKRRHLNLT